MNFYRAVFLEKNFLENIHKKGGFWGNYPIIFTLSSQSLAASAAVLCTQPHVILLKYGEI